MTARILSASSLCFVATAAMALSSTFAVADDAAPAAPAASPTNGGTMALVVNDAGAQTLLALPVQTSKGEDLGHVVDVVVDRSGALLAAIVDFGGFLGVGSRKIAVDWRILHFRGPGDMNKLIADLPLDQLRDAPAFKPSEPIVIMGAAPSPTSGLVVTSPTPRPTAPAP